MQSRAIANLEAIRRAGHKPAADVWLWLDSWPEWSDGGIEIHVGPQENVARLDLRPLVGCTVVMFVEAMSPRAASLLECLRPLCYRVDIVIAAWMDRGETGFRIERDGEPHEFPLGGLH